MTSNEDWAWALRADADRALRANGLTHPLDNIDKQFRFAGASFGASAIGTLRRCVKQHFRFLQPDLDTLQTCDLITLLNSIPVSCEPVAPEAPQQQQTVDITVPQQQ